MSVALKIRNLSGPILVIGASGFIGANLLRMLLSEREDVVGTFFSGDSWRLKGISAHNLIFLNLQDQGSVQDVLTKTSPGTIFDCSSFGAYSFEQDFERIHKTNYLSFIHLMEAISPLKLSAFVHAGSSSEYGLNAAGPDEDTRLLPNSHYAVSKAATSQAISFYGKVRGLPVVNLRLYSVYGPYEDTSRLIPVLCERSLRGELPPFARPEVARDFIYVDDVLEAFVDAALEMGPELAGESINIGSGIQTSLGSLAEMARTTLGIDAAAEFKSEVGRAWDVDAWYANTEKAERLMGWRPRTYLRDGLIKTRDWWQSYLSSADFNQLTKEQSSRKDKNSITAVVACYKDAQAIPIMYERLVQTFATAVVDYEIIFVNDNSPDDSSEVIRRITARDPHVIGITHSRNFGSQSAFRSGMELASKEACVLLDGDLQDPPEVIEHFINKWREGADVVYGRRTKREMPAWLEVCYRGFYRLLAAMSDVPIPKDAGDFSLLDRTVVHWILRCHEHDSFLRGLRAYVGFRQVSVDYVRPERMFGVSTNNWIKNIGWAKKAIFSFSRMPLHLLTAFGGVAFLITILLSVAFIGVRLIVPDSVPKGITFLSLLIMFFGSTTILGLGLLGEYIGKILEETKARPPFIRKDIILHGEVKPAAIRKEGGGILV